MSAEDWRRSIGIAAVVAIVVVATAILATDLALGGPDEPQPENMAPPAPSIGAVTPAPVTYVPPPTYTPTPGPTAVPGPVAQMQDQRRRDDLANIAAALEQYHAKEGEYPSTGGNAQTACNYPDVDALCKLKDYIDPLPTDPKGDPGQNGYWYISDGTTFTLVAAMDSSADATPATCESQFAEMLKKENLYCLTSGQ
jgi:type II secretory pathway pseudopilin PulG